MTARLYAYDETIDSLDLSPGKIAAAGAALALITGRIESISLLVISAQKAGADRLLIDQDLHLLQSEIRNAAGEADFRAGSWLSSTRSWGGGAARTASDDGSPFLEYTPLGGGVPVMPPAMGWDGDDEFQGHDHGEGHFLSFNTFGASDAALRGMIRSLLDALSDLSTAKTFLGRLASLSDDRGGRDFVFGARVRSLVDADMDADSTRLIALETQQMLGVQSLSIANDNASVILKLFG
jgi:flagellin